MFNVASFNELISLHSIAALNGLPGPYIKWFMDGIGPFGLHRMIKDWEDKSATAICMIAFSENVDSPVHIFKGTSEGRIVEPRGSLEFGWDPCFEPKGYSQTYGEMDEAMKNKISHRFNSLVLFKEFITSKK